MLGSTCGAATGQPNNSLDASGTTSTLIDNLTVAWLTPAASTPTLDFFLMRKIAFNRTSIPLVACFVALVFLPLVRGQQSVAPEDQAAVRNRGWNIQSFRFLKVKTQAPIEGQERAVNCAVLLVPEGGILLEDTAYYVVVDGKRTLHPSPMNAYTVSRFDVDGRVFGYTASVPGVSVERISKTQKSVAALGCESFFAFYDEDGDGRFETMVSIAYGVPFKVHVPTWVLRRHRLRSH